MDIGELDPPEGRAKEINLLVRKVRKNANEYQQQREEMRYPNEIFITPHFRWNELASPDGDLIPKKIEVNIFRLCTKLEKLRSYLGDQPVFILSGYRSQKYNKKVGGARRSQHLLGNAADITVRKKSVAEIAKAAEEVGFTGIGLYHKSNFVHCDIRLKPARWTG